MYLNTQNVYVNKHEVDTMVILTFQINKQTT